VDAATRCFERWGIPKTTMEDVAREAEMPRPHIYRHFANKEALLDAVIIRAFQEHHARLAKKYPVRGPAADLIFHWVVDGIREAPTEAPGLRRDDSFEITAEKLRALPEVSNILHAYWVPILQHAADRGELREHVDIDAAIKWLTFLQLTFQLVPDVSPLEESLTAFVLPALLHYP